MIKKLINLKLLTVFKSDIEVKGKECRRVLKRQFKGGKQTGKKAGRTMWHAEKKKMLLIL